MPKHSSHAAWIILVNFLLTACANMEAPSTQRALCAQLRSDLVINPRTGDERWEEIQRAQSYLQAYEYDVKCQNTLTRKI